MQASRYWKGAIAKYRTKDWSDKPSIFAESLGKYLPKSGDLLELGAGAGNDGEYFSQLGFNVTQADLADFRSEGNRSSQFLELDMSNQLRLPSQYYVIYAHLSVHYFSTKRTQELFAETNKHLSKGEVFAFLVNSTHDPEFGKGQELEKHYFDLVGIPKRYFDIADTRSFINRLFTPLLLDDDGTSYKDREDGMLHLFRFVGRKK